jgi:hypothetical protein
MNRTSRVVLVFPRFRKVVCPHLAAPVALALLLFSTGCLSTTVQVHPGADVDRAGILVRVYDNPDAAKDGAANAHGTLVELFKVEKNGDEVFLQRSLAGEWGVDGLLPGRYRLKVPAIIDAGGNIRETRSGDRETDVTLKAGTTSEVRIILKKTPTGLIVAASITVVLLVVAAAILMSDHNVKIPPPPLPPPELLFPPLYVPLRPVVLSSEIWIVPPMGVERAERMEPAVPPRVTSVVPAPGATVTQRFVRPTLTLSQPIDERRLTPETMLMLGSASGLIRGDTVYRRGLLQFQPERELVPGETVTVTVRARGVVNPGGGRMEGDFSWNFRVAGVGETVRE